MPDIVLANSSSKHLTRSECNTGFDQDEGNSAKKLPFGGHLPFLGYVVQAMATVVVVPFGGAWHERMCDKTSLTNTRTCAVRG